MSYVTAYYHIVFATQNREAVIAESHCRELYRVMEAIISKRDCKVQIINGAADHIHILLSLSPDVALAELMRELRSQTSAWAKQSGYFPGFQDWASEYGSFSLSESHRQAVYDFVARQKEHHKEVSLDEEFKRLVQKNGLEYFDWE